MRISLEISKTINRVLNVRGKIIKVRFDVDGKEFEAYVQDDQCFGAIKDILLNREYEYLHEFELKNFRNQRIVDAGAHVGLFSLVASRFAREVVAIEPHPLNYKLLKMNLAENNVGNVFALNKALWHKTSRLRMYEGSYSGQNSIFRTPSKCYKVQTITLDDVVEEFGDIDLLKIDIEGAEFDVIEKLNHNARYMVSEIHLEKGDIGSLTESLRTRGFIVRRFDSPLVKEERSSDVVLHDFIRLKFVSNMAHAAAIFLRKENRDLAMIFATRAAG